MKPITFRPGRLTRLGQRHKARAGLAAVVAGCVAVTSVVVLTAAGDPDSGLKFTQSGHWVYNSAIGRIFHLDGPTREVDAQVELGSGKPGAQVVQTDKKGYVLSQSRIDQFGKSDLTVEDPIEVPVAEQPVGLEAGGAAFAIYREAGRVMRFGDKEAIAFPGGPLGDPVVTSDGTLWVHRVNEGDLCQLPLDADKMTCPAATPKGHKGGLTAIGAKAVFVDLTARQVYRLGGDGIDNRSDLGDVGVPDDALVAGNDVDGKLALVDPAQGKVQLVDVPAGPGTKPAAPISRSIKPGKYDKVASSGRGLALLDRKNDELVTLDRDGKAAYQKIVSHQTPSEVKREPNLFRGDDSRVYVESSKGDRVVVVDHDGHPEAVEVGTDDNGTGKPAKPTTPPSTPVTPPKTQQPPPETQRPPAKTTPPPHTPGKGGTTPPDNDKPTPGKTNTPPPKTTPPKKPTNQPTAKPGLPGAPTSIQARIVDNSTQVNWKAAAPHGAAVTSYRLSWTGGSKTVSGSTLATTIAGLASKTAYYVSVQAVNKVGAGPAVRSNRVQNKWLGAESPRELLVKTDGVSGTLGLAWDAPEMRDGTFVHYAVSMGSQTKTTTALGITWSGLTNGKKYTFTVRAITRAPDGQILTGYPDILTASPVGVAQRTKRVVASRGAGAEYNECDPPDCAFLQVRIENLRPNTKYEIKPFTEDWGNFNPGATLTTSSEGHMLVDDRFPCSAVGQKVWVTVTGPEGTYTSNIFVWKSG
ncbi:fibronectin type III domain-containing protein [Kribbella pittospori]|uniref:Fibronectin type III domain-containing protein n=1 Tax=Kribbella pittospori TaxID=722689 RepID=A0A4V6N4T5_9ACTN|nr:fibronectin type III domain-containing protein [Kribbella pittospori]TCC58272.1 fibronectin type III domain-containing protein [Kribbella pittospori]